jgi:hypothetical protein
MISDGRPLWLRLLGLLGLVQSVTQAGEAMSAHVSMQE